MPTRRPKTLVSQLPPTPCTLEMRERMLEIADMQGKSIAEVQREAFALFLSQNDRLSIKNESQVIAKGEQ